MVSCWPQLDYEADRQVIETLHAYLQVVGKLPIRALPWLNHGWHVALRVVPRGFRTYPIPFEAGEAEVLVDCLAGNVEIATSTGEEAAVSLAGRTVADFHEALTYELRGVGVTADISGSPNEIEDAVPFAEDHRERAWNHDVVRNLHRAFSDANRVFESFRTGFVGKSSPAHLFWGSFDLAVTRFSGQAAPLHSGGIPNLPDRVTREAYSHEVASFGFWPGGGGVNEAAFYAYGYPTPDGLRASPVEPGAAYWHDQLGEFVLPYEAVRTADNPDDELRCFLSSTYAAVADRASWDRAALEIPAGRVGEPYDVAAWREEP
jgi:hypothetical protein